MGESFNFGLGPEEGVFFLANRCSLCHAEE